jgi:mycothiol system anti-sigma-R factor
MTATDPCDDILNELYRFLDGEIDAGERSVIESHLRDCAPCLEAFDFETELRRVIASRCAERMPDDLKARILDAIDKAE